MYRRATGKILRKLCEYKGVGIVEANVCLDNMPVKVKILPSITYGVFKIKSFLVTLWIFQLKISMQSDIMERGCCVINYINKLTIKNIMKLIVECNTRYI